MKAIVLLNPAAGTLAASDSRTEAEQIRSGFAEHGVEADVRLVDGADLGEAVGRAVASDAEVVIAGGGDGTINAVASALVGTGKVLGILPLGTLNHLAKELNIPSDLREAVAALARGRIEEFHLGEVNGRYFLLFSGIGLYSEVIKHRDAQRKARGRNKWPAMVVAFFKVLWRFPLYGVRLAFDERDQRRLTPLLFVTMSDYQRKLFGVEAIACDGRNALSVYVARAVGRLEMVWMIVRLLLRLRDPRRNLEAICTDAMEVRLRRRHVRVALDGEVVDMEPPLRYRIVRNGLRMLMPV